MQDPDSYSAFVNTRNQVINTYCHLGPDISITYLERGDRLLNAIVSKAHVVLQLSRSEGIEVGVSEALHAGRSVIVTKAGGMPLQVKPDVDGFLGGAEGHQGSEWHSSSWNCSRTRRCTRE